MAPVIFHHETRIFQPRLIPGYTLRGIAWVKVGHPEMVYSSKKKISKHPSSNTKLSLFLKYLEIILNHFKSIFKYSQFRRETTLPWKRLQVEALKGLIPQSNRQSARRLTMKPCNKCLANRFPVNGCDFPVNRPIFLFQCFNHHRIILIIVIRKIRPRKITPFQTWQRPAAVCGAKLLRLGQVPRVNRINDGTGVLSQGLCSQAGDLTNQRLDLRSKDTVEPSGI